jgi:hypothetical protein
VVVTRSDGTLIGLFFAKTSTREVTSAGTVFRRQPVTVNRFLTARPASVRADGQNSLMAVSQ